jgi:hypothetical protein
LPVECDQLPIDGERGAELSGADALVEPAQKLLVAVGQPVTTLGGIAVLQSSFGQDGCSGVYSAVT